jgi:hypothetical protein
MKKLFEVEWIDTPNKLEIKVWPIKVVREGILPGCLGITITGIDKDGQKFQGNPGNYYETEQEALEATKQDLVQSLVNLKEDQKQIAKDLIRFQNCLNNL